MKVRYGASVETIVAKSSAFYLRKCPLSWGVLLDMHRESQSLNSADEREGRWTLRVAAAVSICTRARRRPTLGNV